MGKFCRTFGRTHYVAVLSKATHRSFFFPAYVGVRVWQFGQSNRRFSTVVTHNESKEAKGRIEKLLTARILNQSPDHETATWLAGGSDDIHQRIARVGLCAPREPAPLSPTLEHWLSKYPAQRKAEPDFKPGSYDRLRQTGDRPLAHFGADTAIDSITPDVTKDWRYSMLAEATVRTHCRNANTIFNEAVDRELIPRSPFAKLKSSAIAADKDRIIDSDETLALLEAAPNVQWRVLIGLARLAGLRTPSETHILQWAGVGIEGSVRRRG